MVKFTCNIEWGKLLDLQRAKNHFTELLAKNEQKMTNSAISMSVLVADETDS